MKYRQLTEGTRYQIALLPGEKISLTETSKRAGTTEFREGSEHRAIAEVPGAEMYPDCPVCIACTRVNVNTNCLLRQLARKEPPCRQGLKMTRSTTWLR